MHEFDLGQPDALVIEHYGDRVPPAAFNLGRHQNVTLHPTSEGDDKSAKHTVKFGTTSLFLLSIRGQLDVLENFARKATTVHSSTLADLAPVLCSSAGPPAGLTSSVDWIDQQRLRQRVRQRVSEDIE
ncbi:MAG TPA: hypothetical protein VEI29_04145 [Burkholderiaceae bacterium]|nr:hypothetical protein [Burkholderiaceae bacterium]